MKVAFLTAVGVVAVAAGVLGVVVSSDPTTPVATADVTTSITARDPAPAHNVHLVAVGWREGPFVADPVTGATAPLAAPPGPALTCNTCEIVAVDDRAFLASGGRLLEHVAGSGAWRDVGSADRIEPSAPRGGLLVGLGPEVEERSLDGTRTGGPWTAPPGWASIAAFEGGLIVSKKPGFAGPLGLWRAGEASVTPLSDHYNQFIDTDGGQQAAWTECPTDDFPCSLVLADLATDDRIVVEPPIHGNGFYDGGAYSPDGRTLAVFVSTTPGTVNPGAALVLVEVESGSAEVIDGTAFGVGEPYGYAAWSPDGTTVFFTGIDGARSYSPADGVVTDLGLPGTYYSVAVLPAVDRDQCPGALHSWQRGPAPADESGDGLPAAGTVTREVAAVVAADVGGRVWSEPARTWSRRSDGSVSISPELVATVVVGVAAADCPAGPSFADGVPIVYVVG